jgi:hypothetical protein
MEIQRLFMSLLAELGRLGDGFCYKHVTPSGAPAASASAFNPALVFRISNLRHHSPDPSHRRTRRQER